MKEAEQEMVRGGGGSRTGGGAEPRTIVMQAFLDEVKDALFVHLLHFSHKVHGHQRPVDTAHPEVLHHVKSKARFLLGKA